METVATSSGANPTYKTIMPSQPETRHTNENQGNLPVGKIRSDFKEFLIGLRKSKGVSQETVSKDVGVSHRTYHRWENLNKRPNLKRIQKLSDYFGVPINDFFEKEG